MTLKSRSELQLDHSKTIDLMDVNQVLEVPDTPDRLVASRHDSDHNNINNRKTSADYMNGNIRNQQREKGKSVITNGNRRLFIHHDSSSSFKHPRPHVDTTKHDKGKALCNSDVQKFTHQEGGQNGHNRANASRKGVLSLNRVVTTDSLDKSIKSCNKKGVDFLDTNHHRSESSMQPCTSLKVPQKKMLVRNGCISPNNIAKSKHVSKNHEIGSVVKEAKSGSSTVNIMDLVSEDKDSHRCKGKGVLHHHHSSSKDLNTERTIHKESSIESEKWRTPHNNRKQRDNDQQKKGNDKDYINLEESFSSMSPHTHLLGVNRQKEGTSTTSRNLGKRSVSLVDDSVVETSNSRSKRNKNLNGVGPSNPITCNNEDSSVRDLQVEADEMLARELQEQLYNEEMVPEIDEMDSHLAFSMPAQQDNNSSQQAGGRHVNRSRNPWDPSSITARERSHPRSNPRRSLAQRALQPRSQQQQPRTSSTRMSNLRAQFRSRPQSNSNRRHSMFPSDMDVDMVWNGIMVVEEGMEWSITVEWKNLCLCALKGMECGAGFSFYGGGVFLYSELRMEILETLEAVGDMRRPNGLLQIGREFNEDDYEMLLALDDDNHRHGGATRAQINNLPESIVQAENLQECSICLETPTIGETIRHLPCLHRFHKACIDQWLRRKTSCPICKSSIT